MPRPRIYASAAERQRAYRERKKAQRNKTNHNVIKHNVTDNTVTHNTTKHNVMNNISTKRNVTKHQKYYPRTVSEFMSIALVLAQDKSRPELSRYSKYFIKRLKAKRAPARSDIAKLLDIINYALTHPNNFSDHK